MSRKWTLHDVCQKCCDDDVTTPPEPIRTEDDDSEVVTDCLFQPGPIGLELQFKTGRVKRVVGDCQGERLGVQVGWRIQSIDDQPYSFTLLKAKVEDIGRRPYLIRFCKEPERASVQGALNEREAIKLGGNDDARYQGEWNGQVREGCGVMVWSDDSRYEGEWKGNAPHGHGTYSSDDYKYTGQFEDGEKHGQGNEAWTDGRSFDGQFCKGVREGEGTFRWAGGRSTYVGQWQGGSFSGRGVLAVRGTGEQTGIAEQRGHYEGEFLAGQKHGQGTFIWEDGRSYRGEWKGGQQHGRGRYITPDGQATGGTWKRGRVVGWDINQEAAEGPEPGEQRPDAAIAPGAARTKPEIISERF